MGDRCFVQLTLRRSDLQRFRAVTEWGHCFMTDDDENGTSAAVDGYIDEVNYWGEDQLDAAAAQGIPFYGVHESGCAYGRGHFLSDGKRCCELPVDGEGFASVRYDPETGLHADEKKDRSNIKRFSVKLRRVKQLVNGKESACPN